MKPIVKLLEKVSQQLDVNLEFLRKFYNLIKWVMIVNIVTLVVAAAMVLLIVFK